MLGTTAAALPESPFGLPLWLGVIVMFGIAVTRAQLTYWVGRAAGAGFAGSRWARRIGTHHIERAEAAMARYGPVAVTASFLTIGVQTAVNFIAGTTRMPFGRYLAAMLVGSALWSVVWTVGGLGVVWAWLALAARSPVAAAILAVALAAVVVLVVWRSRRSTSAPVSEVPANEGKPG